MNHKKVLFLVVFIAILIAAIEGQTSPEYKILFEKAKFTMETKGDLNAAIALFNDIIKKYPKEREYAAKSQLLIGQCYEKMGVAEARKAYERVLRDYADQAEPTKLAQERLKALAGGSDLTTDLHEAAKRRIWISGNNSPLSITPDGRHVIFSMYDNGDLWLRDLQSGEQKQITHEASLVEWSFANGPVAVSPDGKWIAYTWLAKSNGELRLSMLNGSSMQVLSTGQDGRRMFTCKWMPDGRHILASSIDRRDNAFRRHIFSLPDGTIRDIGQPEAKEVDWGYSSPDGRQIVYGLNADIYIYNVSTDQSSVLVQNPKTDNIVDWTIDGSGILFTSDRSGTNDLYFLRINNGKPHGAPELIRPNLGLSSNLRLARDGRLFQIENTGTVNSLIFPLDEQTGKPTGTASLVEPNYPNSLFPGWSSDGSQLYYEIMKETTMEQLLFMRQEATGQVHEIILKPKLQYWYRPILSPDGKQFAVTGTAENMNFGIFAIDPESGEVSQLAKIPTENEPIDPSQNYAPNSKSIFYKVRSPEQSENFIIRRKDLITGEEKDVYSGIHTREMKISPDGTRFAYFRNDQPTKSHVIGILDLQSGKEMELSRVPEAECPEISGIAWTSDGKYVLVTMSIRQGTELWRFSTGGGPGEKLHYFPDMSMGFVIHPSGRQLAITQVHMNYELWVLENFLPK